MPQSDMRKRSSFYQQWQKIPCCRAFNHISMGIIITINGRVQFMNQKMSALLKTKPRRCYGKKINCLFEESKSVQERIEKGDSLLKKETTCLFFKSYLSFSEEESGHYFLIRTFKIDPHNKKAGICWVFEDVTAQKEKEIFEQYQQTSFRVFEMLRQIDVKKDKYQIFYQLLTVILKQYHLKTAIFLENKDKKLICSFLAGEDQVFPNLFKKLSVFDSQVKQSIAYQALMKKKAIGCNNIMKQPFYRKYLKRPREKTILSTYAFPIILSKKVEGVISLYSYESDFFSPQVVKQLSQLIQEISLFIEEARAKLKNQQAISQYEEKLQKQIQTLEENKKIMQKQAEESNKIVADLVMAQHQAEAATRSKMNFLANVSHELRTPLNAILGFSEAMYTETFGPLSNPQYKEYTSFIFSSAQHLLSLINDILDLSKMEAEKFKLMETRVDVRKSLKEAIALVEQYPYEGKRLICLHKSPHIVIRADERAFKQIFLNVLSNAVKFTKDEGHIDVFIRLTTKSVRFIVKDDGIGVPKEKINQLFQPFSQIENILTRTHEGSGLGLVLVKKMVILHQGKVMMKSVLKKGTSIIIDFPKDRIISMGANE